MVQIVCPAREPIDGPRGSCTEAETAWQERHYGLGSSFRRRPLRDVLKVCELRFQDESVRTNYISYLYTGCRSCQAYVAIQNWRSCERNYSSYELGPGLGPDPRDDLELRAVPAAFFGSDCLELYTGRTTVVIFGPSRRIMRRAAAALREVAGDRQFLPRTPTLAPPEPGAMEGKLNC